MESIQTEIKIMANSMDVVENALERIKGMEENSLCQNAKVMAEVDLRSESVFLDINDN